MAAVVLSDLKSVRRALNLSQSELARTLNISLRAVQSYEQGWRPTPVHVQQLAAMMLHLDWRRRGGRPVRCWRIRGCTPAARASCLVAHLGAGEVCWLFGGAANESCDCHENRLDRCAQCAVMRTWLADEPSDVSAD